MQRRRFVTMMGTALSLSLPGCFSGAFGEDSDPDPRERPQPKKPLEEPEATVMKAEIIEKPTEYGSLDFFVHGLVKNTGSTRIEDPEVQVKFHNREGLLLEWERESIYSLKPGQVWEIQTEYLGRVAAVPAKGSIEVGLLKPIQNYSPPPGVKTSGVTVTKKENVPTIVGEIKNTSNQSFIVHIHGQFLNEDKHVVGSGDTYVDDLNDGETQTFEIRDYSPVASNVVGYDVYMSTQVDDDDTLF